MRIFINENYNDIYKEGSKLYNFIINTRYEKNKNEIIKDLIELYKILKNVSTPEDQKIYDKQAYIFLIKYFRDIKIYDELIDSGYSDQEVKSNYPNLYSTIKNNLYVTFIFASKEETYEAYFYGLDNEIIIYIRNIINLLHNNPVRNFKYLHLELQIYKIYFIHELVHAYDYYRSKTKAFNTSKNINYKKYYKAFGKDPAYEDIIYKLYHELDTEVWARFVEFLHNFDDYIFTTNYNNAINYLKGDTVLGFKKLNPKIQRNLLAKFTKIYSIESPIYNWEKFNIYRKNGQLIDDVIQYIEDYNSLNDIYNMLKMELNNLSYFTAEQKNEVKQYALYIYNKVKKRGYKIDEK